MSLGGGGGGLLEFLLENCLIVEKNVYIDYSPQPNSNMQDKLANVAIFILFWRER